MTLLTRLLCLWALLWPTYASAQTEAAYPSRPITLVVTVPPGGAADFTGRLVASRMQEALGQSIVIVNRGGASGTIATDSVAKAKPDGYTLLLNAISTHGIGPHLFASLPYDPVKDFVPIGLVAKIPLIMVVNSEVPAKTVGDVIALAKASPGKLSFATPGKGGAPHLAAELFKSVTGTDLLHVPYKGSGPAVVDVAAGRVQIMFDGVPAFWPFIESGKLRPLAAASSERNKVLPDMPTFAELGFKGLEVYLWYGLVAPAGTPEPIVRRLNAELLKALSSDAVKDGFAKQSINPGGGSPDDFAKFMREEMDRWGRIVKDAKIEPE